MIIKDLPNVFRLKGVESLIEISIVLTKVGGECIKSMNDPKKSLYRNHLRCLTAVSRHYN